MIITITMTIIVSYVVLDEFRSTSLDYISKAFYSIYKWIQLKECINNKLNHIEICMINDQFTLTYSISMIDG